jgi:DedD protein
MEEKNELNDIILNKNSSSAGNKKIILAAATLGIILIVVIMLMNSLTSSKTDNLPQAALPPEPQKEIIAGANEPLFEEVNVVREAPQENGSLDKIAQKLKEESIKESAQVAPAPQVQSSKTTTTEPKKIETSKAIATRETPKESPKTAPVSPTVTASSPTAGGHYIQVGSFEKHQPDDKFLNSILKLGYKYKFHEVKANGRTVSKVLVGPFPSQEEARKALVNVRSSVEPGAFLTKI